MKKIILLVLMALLMVSMLTVALADTHGLAVITTFGAVKNAEIKDGEMYEGVAPIDSVSCSVVLDDNGLIKSVRFDVVQPRIKFDVEGKLIEGDYTTAIPSKIDKGDAYGMIKASPIGKEWFEQIAAFEEYCIGKTVDEIANMPTKNANEDHPSVPDVADLTATVTMNVSEFIEVLVKAASLAK
ncbi:MAG: hypothetical protein GX781_05190 [Clostridiales bacterium]|nr:hypothetical protein [Clostridiales bacterium]